MEYRFKGHLVEELYKDYRIKEGMKACMNCGVCTAVCPAAEFYKYNPKNIVNIVARKNEADLEELLRSDTIWYCGECMSCVTRCPGHHGVAQALDAKRVVYGIGERSPAVCRG